METQSHPGGNLSEENPILIANLFTIKKATYASPASSGLPSPKPALAAIGYTIAELKEAIDAHPDFYINLALGYNSLVVMHKDYAPAFWILIADAEPKAERK